MSALVFRGQRFAAPVFPPLFLVFVFFTQSIFAQNKYTVSGYVRDKNSGETLISAGIYIKELLKGGITNEYGYYSLTVAEGKYTISANYIGYRLQEIPIDLTHDVHLNIELEPKAIITNEVVVSGERKDKNVESTDMGKVELATKEIKSIPAFMGEVDVLKAIQLLPGVQSSGEGNSGFYVRGGGPDQNLILLDEAVVYNTGHLLGFFSVFNSDAIKSTTLIKGGMPANYGGRLSSVLDIAMKEGNMKKYQVEGGIGFISSRLTIQGPIVKEKASFIVSGRRTYFDLISKPVLKKVRDGEFAGNSYYFYDINGKINYKFSDKDHLYLSGYFGRDVFKFSNANFSADIPWGNATATLRWNHLFNDKLFMNATGIFNNYRFEINSGFKDIKFSLYSEVRDYNAKLDFDWFYNINHHMEFGAEYTFHTFTPYSASGQAGDTKFQTDELKKKYAHETAIYFLDDFSISDRFKINAGVRASLFNHVGPLQKTIYDDQGRSIDTLKYGRGKLIATYWGIEPRLSARIKLDDKSSVKAGITYTNQYIHLVSSSTTTLPTDIWVPSTAYVKPQIAIQYSIGYFRNFKNDMFETSIELYYKDMRNQIEYGESFAPELNSDLEDGFVFGRGYSTGAEFFVKKTFGKINGWIGYTLSWTWKKFSDLNQGKRFPAKYDRRHDLSVLLIYEINKKWKLGATFVFATGQSTTVPIGRYFIEGQIVNQYGDKNGYRLAPYHRLDLSVTYVMTKKKRYNDLTLSIYNAYNRKNPYFIYYDINGSVTTGDLEVSAKQVSLFPIMPTLTWNFKF